MPIAPRYAWVADILRDRIRQRIWRPGDRLPSEKELCSEMGISSITMRHAMSILVSEGLITRAQGKGSFVASDHVLVQGPSRLTSFTEDARARGWHGTAKVLGFEIVSSGEVSSKLELPGGASLIKLSRLRMADGLPVAVQTAYLPAQLFPGLESFDLETESLYEVMKREYGIRPATAVETYRAIQLTEGQAPMLGCQKGSPAFHVERLSSDGTGQKIEFVQSIIRADRYSLVLHLAASQ